MDRLHKKMIAIFLFLFTVHAQMVNITEVSENGIFDFVCVRLTQYLLRGFISLGFCRCRVDDVS